MINKQQHQIRGQMNVKQSRLPLRHPMKTWNTNWTDTGSNLFLCCGGQKQTLEKTNVSDLSRMPFGGRPLKGMVSVCWLITLRHVWKHTYNFSRKRYGCSWGDSPSKFEEITLNPSTFFASLNHWNSPINLPVSQVYSRWVVTLRTMVKSFIYWPQKHRFFETNSTGLS